MQAGCVLGIFRSFHARAIFIFVSKVIVVFSISWPFVSTTLALSFAFLSGPALAFALFLPSAATAAFPLVSIFGLLIIFFARSIFECLRDVRIVVRAFGISHQAKHLLTGLLLIPFLMLCSVASDLKTNQILTWVTKRHTRFNCHCREPSY